MRRPASPPSVSATTRYRDDLSSVTARSSASSSSVSAPAGWPTSPASTPASMKYRHSRSILSKATSGSSAHRRRRKAATVHKLQLISGRVLSSIPLATAERPARFTDIAVTPQNVLVLDGEGRRVYRVAKKGRTLEMIVQAGGAIVLEPRSWPGRRRLRLVRSRDSAPRSRQRGDDCHRAAGAGVAERSAVDPLAPRVAGRHSRRRRSESSALCASASTMPAGECDPLTCSMPASLSPDRRLRPCRQHRLLPRLEWLATSSR